MVKKYWHENKFFLSNVDMPGHHSFDDEIIEVILKNGKEYTGYASTFYWYLGNPNPVNKWRRLTKKEKIAFDLGTL